MDEITIRIEIDPTSTMRTGSKAFENAVKRIENEMIRGNKAGYEIAKQLAKIRDKKLFESAGYTTFSDFSEEYFGISKSNADSLADLLNFLHDNDVITDITITYKI